MFARLSGPVNLDMVYLEALAVFACLMQVSWGSDIEFAAKSIAHADFTSAIIGSSENYTSL